MKALLFFLSLAFLFSSLPAQQIRGRVFENLSDQGMAAVEIQAKGFSTQSTDELGRFSLSLPGKKAGDMIVLQVLREGYAVINRENLRPRIPNTPHARIDLYLCSQSDRMELALKHYKIQVEKNLEVAFEKRLQPLLDSAKVREIARLYEQKEVAGKMADSLAARLARFDPELASPELAHAMQLYQSGSVKDALDILKPDELVERLRQQQATITNLQKSIRLDIRSLMQAGDIALSSLQFDKAHEYFEAAVRSDTTAIWHLDTFCRFLFSQNQSKKLIQYAQMMKHASPNGSRAFTKALHHYGAALSWQNELEKALDVFEESLHLTQELVRDSAKTIGKLLLESDLANAMNSIGFVKRRLNRHQEAIEAYKVSLEKFRVLEELHPGIYREDIVVGLNNLGAAYAYLRDFSTAADIFEEAVEIVKKQDRDSYPGFDRELGFGLVNLSNAWKNLHREEEAIAPLEEAQALFQQLAQQNPQRFESSLGIVYNNQGILYKILHDYPKSVQAYEHARRLFQKLAIDNPQRYQLMVANVLINLGGVQQQMDQFEEALLSYQTAREIYQPMAKNNPESFELNLAKILINISLLYRDWLYIHPDSHMLELATASLEPIPASLDRCPEVAILSLLRKAYQEVREVFETADLRELKLVIPTRALKNSLKTRKTYPEKILLQTQIIEVYESAFARYPDAPHVQEWITDGLDTLALWQLMNAEFAGAESSARKCLKIDPEYHSAYRGLAPSLLLQGKFSQARKIYLKWKDQTWQGEGAEQFGEVFQQDLVKFNKAGIIGEDRKKDEQKILKLLQR